MKKSVPIALIAILFMQSCVTYQKQSVSVTEAANVKGPIKAVSKEGKIVRLSDIIIKHGEYYGITLKDKVEFPLISVETSYYTGIRFSEMPYIDINNLDGQVLSFYIPKTSKSHQIPLNGKALDLLKKVKRFNPISQQKENKYIKELARRAKINRPVQRVKLSGSVSTVETFPKWKLCSSHTARRTWARIAYDAGVDILKISRYIGHSDIATTLKYIGHKDTDFDELKDLF